MELVIIIATITAFFSHFLIDRGAVANAVSVLAAMLMTWALAEGRVGGFDGGHYYNWLIIAAIALTLSLIVGLIFAYHKKCS